MPLGKNVGQNIKELKHAHLHNSKWPKRRIKAAAFNAAGLSKESFDSVVEAYLTVYTESSTEGMGQPGMTPIPGISNVGTNQAPFNINQLKPDANCPLTSAAYDFSHNGKPPKKWSMLSDNERKIEVEKIKAQYQASTKQAGTMKPATPPPIGASQVMNNNTTSATPAT